MKLSYAADVITKPVGTFRPNWFERTPKFAIFPPAKSTILLSTEASGIVSEPLTGGLLSAMKSLIFPSITLNRWKSSSYLPGASSLRCLMILYTLTETAVHLVLSYGMGDRVEVPSVLELGIDAARHVIAERGLTVGDVSHRESEVEAGTVIGQEPAPGTLVAPETAVHLVV